MLQRLSILTKSGIKLMFYHYFFVRNHFYCLHQGEKTFISSKSGIKLKFLPVFFKIIFFYFHQGEITLHEKAGC